MQIHMEQIKQLHSVTSLNFPIDLGRYMLSMYFASAGIGITSGELERL